MQAASTIFPRKSGGGLIFFYSIIILQSPFQNDGISFKTGSEKQSHRNTKEPAEKKMS